MRYDNCLDTHRNLRSALDSLTYALAVTNLGRVPSKQEVRVIQFVLLDDPIDWSREAYRLNSLDPGARGVIESLQPYQPSQGLNPKVHALSILRELSNIDKHRHMNLTLLAISHAEVDVAGAGIPLGTKIGGYRGPLVEGAVIARARLSGGIEHPDIHMHAKSELDVQFGTGPAHRASVIAELRRIETHIASEVIPKLEPFLGPSAVP